MTYTQYKRNSKKGSYEFHDGKLFLAPTLDVIKPVVASSRCPALNLLNRGRLISRLYQITDSSPNILVGTSKAHSLLFMFKEHQLDMSFELFGLDIPLERLHEQLVTGGLNEALSTARKINSTINPLLLWY